MFNNNYRLSLFLTAVLSISSQGLLAGDSDWSVDATVGLSSLGNTYSTESQVETDVGFNLGISLNKKIFQNSRIDIGWEYRTNDSETLNADGVFEGNFASNILWANYIVEFEKPIIGSWRGYVGIGALIAQEIDIDLETDTQAQSFSASGDVSLQYLLGAKRRLAGNTSVAFEYRGYSLNDITLEKEEGAGQMVGLDYQVSGLSLKLSYDF